MKYRFQIPYLEHVGAVIRTGFRMCISNILSLILIFVIPFIFLSFEIYEQKENVIAASDSLHELEQISGVGSFEILCVKRSWPKKGSPVRKQYLRVLGFPTNHECQSSLKLSGYQNEIGKINPKTGEFKTIYKPKGKYFVGHINLHWNGEKFLFTMSDSINWKIFEINIDGTGLRQVSQTPDDVDCFESCYLPDGRIIFNSNAAYQCVPCWHGTKEKYTASLYTMNGDGSEMRRVAFDQDHDFHPSVRHNGQVVYARWDYTGINRLFLRPLMTMRPDGTNQRALYGSNSWYANGLYYPKELPGNNGRFLCILSGYHNSNRSGVLSLVDINKGIKEDEGIQIISGKDNPISLKIEDEATGNIWPQFVTPTPITSEKYLVSGWGKETDKKMGIYLASSDNRISLVYEEENMAFLEPIPIIKRETPPVLPSQINLAEKNASVYIQDVYAGPGLKGIPRGVVKDIRVIAYDFGYIGMAGRDKIGMSGPWEAMRILGTTSVEEDGSANFEIPANTPVAFQALDEEGRAVQLMRSWTTAMPGERMSCVGCHESAYDSPIPKKTIAASKIPEELNEWYGPARGFDFEREVQPVLNRYCVSCHNQDSKIDFRSEKHFPNYTGLKPGRLDYNRIHPYFKKKYDGKVLYTPAYENLVQYIRRVNISDDVSMLEPGEYHAGTSELIQLLKEGHKGIKLDKESWSRLYTWIDLNGPCHGTWTDVYNEKIPGNPNKRRWELGQMYGGPEHNPDIIPETPDYNDKPVHFDYSVKGEPKREVFQISKIKTKTLDAGEDLKIKLVNFGQPYWIGECEITNAQFRQFDANHSSRYYGKRHAERGDDKGLSLDNPNQPAIRVSWDRAMEFCDWLSEKTGLNISLPSEEQWEMACVGNKTGSFHFEGNDFSEYENMADSTFATFGYTGISLDGHFQVGGKNCYIAPEGVSLADTLFNDGACVTMPVGSYKPNSLGLYDTHGNAAEWTLTDFNSDEKTVKGGSFLERPERAGVNVRHGFPAWQNVHNVGFRIVVNGSIKEVTIIQ
jgi:formylglycine-generating enzyme required for sulfatase activity